MPPFLPRHLRHRRALTALIFSAASLLCSTGFAQGAPPLSL